MPSIKDVFDEVKNISKKLDDFCIDTAKQGVEIKKNYEEYIKQVRDIKQKFFINDKMHSRLWVAIYGTGGLATCIIAVLKFLGVF
jgi:hypothetical protein